MQNDQGKVVDLYIPRKCTATNRLLHSKDHAAVQINIAMTNDQGIYEPGKHHSIAVSGFMRRKGKSDASINRILSEKGVLSFAD